MICNLMYKGLAGHLKSKHNISTKEYKLKFPNSTTLSKESLSKIIKDKNKKCIHCDNTFLSKDPRNLTCSKKCRYDHRSSKTKRNKKKQKLH